MKNFSLLIVLLTIFGCERVIEIEVPAIQGEPSSTTIKSNVTKVGDNYIIDLDIHVVDDRGRFVSTLAKRDFFFDETERNNQGFPFSLVEIGKSTTAAKGTYSSMLLMDQSGSIVTTDREDARIAAAKVFINNLGQNDEVGLASFTSYLPNNFSVHHNFTRNTAPILVSLDSLSNTEYDGTPLYRSMYEIQDIIEKTARNQNNKALIVFTDGDDTDWWAPTTAQIIEKARSKNIQIYTVALGYSLSNLAILDNIAQKTGGYFMWAEEAAQLISYFGTLGNLLHGNAGYYRTKWSIPAANVRTNVNYLFYLTIQLPRNQVVKMAVPLNFPA